MGLSWCKMASNLDSHPKVRRAGRNGREVFLFVLRQNAEPGNPVPGRLPIDRLEPWYLADQLMMPESDAVTGVTRAVEAGLLELDGHSYVIVGWEAEWSKELEDRREGNRARQAKYREVRDERLKKPVTECDTALPGVTNETVTLNVPRREEKRREEKKRSGKPDSDSVLEFAAVAVREINRLAGTDFDVDSGVALDLSKALLKNRHTLEQAILVIGSKVGWLSDDEKREYFRPSTLLAAKNFAKYLDDMRGGVGKQKSMRMFDPEARAAP